MERNGERTTNITILYLCGNLCIRNKLAIQNGLLKPAWFKENNTK